MVVARNSKHALRSDLLRDVRDENVLRNENIQFRIAVVAQERGVLVLLVASLKNGYVSWAVINYRPFSSVSFQRHAVQKPSAGAFSLLQSCTRWFLLLPLLRSTLHSFSTLFLSTFTIRTSSLKCRE